MTMTNAQVALTAAVQSITPSDVWQGKEFVKEAIEARREDYLNWLEENNG